MADARVRLGRFSRVPVYLHFSWFLVFALLTWTLAVGYFPESSPDLPAVANWAKALVTPVLFFASILLHELGHAVVAMRLGVRIRKVTLFIFGGVSQMEGDPPNGPVEMKIAVAGPVVSLALAALFHLVAGSSVLPGSVRGVARYLAFINVAL